MRRCHTLGECISSLASISDDDITQDMAALSLEDSAEHQQQAAPGVGESIKVEDNKTAGKKGKKGRKAKKKDFE